MAPPATPSPDAHHPSNRRAASSRLFSPKFPRLLPCCFSSYFQDPSLAFSYWLGLSVVANDQWPTTDDLLMFLTERLNLHIHSRRKIKLHQRIHRLRRRVENVQQTLMRADLELLSRLLVHVRRTQHRELVLHRRQ